MLKVISKINFLHNILLDIFCGQRALAFEIQHRGNAGSHLKNKLNVMCELRTWCLKAEWYITTDRDTVVYDCS